MFLLQKSGKGCLVKHNQVRLTTLSFREKQLNFTVCAFTSFPFPESFFVCRFSVVRYSSVGQMAQLICVEARAFKFGFDCEQSWQARK